MTNTEGFAEVFKALSAPLRLEILKLLSGEKQVQQKDLCVCELAEELGVSQPNISHHLKILKQAGLVTCEKNDTFCYYVVNIEKIKQTFSEFANEI
ncbi:MAG: ArsR family transcriptional regulator, arsenate/arsenite/antimonite-responsive transcriptional [Clostridiales bacterium]|jgi:ArsR family transcriptional regulator|nr:ArsR family transcriptional regulator, arsenate/arsenite/antimonite-responsive transcriptional [Clostridiales bacterium]MDK2934353.1 ArsR family transcriptional regulator, arsenate/arsenite/antimonite-responsive transcriptional [Clostridiales bacterium]